MSEVFSISQYALTEKICRDYSSKAELLDIVNSSLSGCPSCRLIYNAWLLSRKLDSQSSNKEDVHQQEIFFWGWGFTANAKGEYHNYAFTRFFIAPGCRHPD